MLSVLVFRIWFAKNLVSELPEIPWGSSHYASGKTSPVSCAMLCASAHGRMSDGRTADGRTDGGRRTERTLQCFVQALTSSSHFVSEQNCTLFLDTLWMPCVLLLQQPFRPSSAEAFREEAIFQSKAFGQWRLPRSASEHCAGLLARFCDGGAPAITAASAGCVVAAVLCDDFAGRSHQGVALEICLCDKEKRMS